LLNQLERKENMDKERLEQLKTMAMANSAIPKGSLENYANVVQAKVERFAEEEKKYGGLTEEEVREAESIIDPNARAMSQSKKAYAKELKKVVEASDVLIEVLDARDPEGCRCKNLEHEMLAAGKKVLLVVNKIDLVPPQNARLWQRYLRREFPCVLFKSNRQQQDNLSSGTALHKQSMISNSDMVESMLHTSKAIGTENLLNILKNYARVEGSASGKTKQ
jgi:nuclear GTP-binding protein